MTTTMNHFGWLIMLKIFCLAHAFRSTPLHHREGSVSHRQARRSFVIKLSVYNEAYELGSSLLERLEKGQVSKDVALSGVPLSFISIETVQMLQNVARNQDLVSLENFPVSSSLLEANKTTLYPSYLSNYSTYPSCQWVKVLPEMQGVFREAFHGVVESFHYYNFSKSPTTIQLSPYDLFHGHLFRRSFAYRPNNHTARISSNSDILVPEDQEAEEGTIDKEGSQNISKCCHHQLGILFHCCEYPAVDNPHGVLANVSLGFHQIGSNCHPTLEEWKFRNVLWLAGWEESLSSPLEPKIWLLNGSAPEISQLQVDGGSFELFGPGSPNTVWEGFLVEPNNGNNGSSNEDSTLVCGESSGLVADIYYGMKDHDGSIWCEIC